MVKTHEIKLSTSAFNQYTESNYIILKANDIEVNDFILFKQIEVVNEIEKETGLYGMAQVQNTISDVGLKDGYILVILRKIN